MSLNKYFEINDGMNKLKLKKLLLSLKSAIGELKN